MKLIQKTMIAFAIACWGDLNAQICNEEVMSTTPDWRFYDNGDGTVEDRKTSLIWMRCALGQAWDGQTCTGDAMTYTWQQALQQADAFVYADSSDWRLPNVNELDSIVEMACYEPAINANIFPQTPSAGFWTSSIKAHNYKYAWSVYFYYGHHYNAKVQNGYVRLVRPDSN